MPPAKDLNGPCLRIVAVRVPVKKETTVVEMLEALQREQSGLN